MGLQRMPAQQFGGINVIDPPHDLNSEEARDLINVRPSSVENLEGIEQRGGALPIIGDAYAPGGFWGAIPIGINQGLNGDKVLLLDETRGIWSLSAMKTYNGGAFAQYYAPAGTDKGIWVGALYGDYVYVTPLAYLTAGATVSADSPKKTSPTSGFTSWTGTNVPKDVRSMVTWRGRLVATQLNLKSAGVIESYLLYSEAGDPTNWGSGPNKLRIPDDTGSLDGKLIVHKNNLYLIKERSLWMIYDPNTLFNRLIAPVGIGTFANLDSAVSCPFDGRLYWLDATSGNIWSTNGETDCVLENTKFPLRASSHPDFSPVWLPTSLGYPDSRVSLSKVSTARMAYDPQRQSILVSFHNTDSNPAADSVSYVVEILLRGKPGNHPIYLHKYQPCITHMFSGGVDDNNTSTGLPGNPSVVHSSPHPSGVTTGRSLFQTFGDSTGGDYADKIGGVVSRNYRPSFWKSGWKPFLSEEPLERVRRINMNYRGALALKYYASSDPSFVAPKVWQSADLAYTSGTKQDRDFIDLRPPAYKGRYHAFDLLSVTTPAERFKVSMLEFVFRGGKAKR